jgi:tetratricopeptide (TPR) repeat protein
LKREIYLLLAQAHRGRGRPERSRATLREGLGLFPNDTRLLSEAGLLALQEGSPGEAEAAFTALLSAPPDPDELLAATDLSLRGWQTRHHLAVLCLHRGRTDEAEAHWLAAVAEAPRAAACWLGLGEVYLGRGAWDELARALDRLQACAPDDSDVSADEAPLLRARAHLARGERARARTVLDRLIARRPDATRPRLLLSLVDPRAADGHAPGTPRAIPPAAPTGEKKRLHASST